jgi:hypothetical protein
MGPMIEKAVQQVASIPEMPIEACFCDTQVACESLNPDALQALRFEDFERTFQPSCLGDPFLRGKFRHDSFRCRRLRLVG